MKHRGHFGITDVDTNFSKIVQKFQRARSKVKGENCMGMELCKRSQMRTCNTRDWTSMSEHEAGNEKRRLKYWVPISVKLRLQLFLKASWGITAQCKEFVFIFSTDRLIVFPLVLAE